MSYSYFTVLNSPMQPASFIFSLFFLSFKPIIKALYALQKYRKLHTLRKVSELMILQVTDITCAGSFAAIYNSANTLFPEKEQAQADAGIFVSQIKNDINFAIQENGIFSAFISYRQCGSLYELTSLYVKRECQKMGSGSKLLSHLEAQMPADGILFVKVLKNAPWARDFYQKHGFLPLHSPCLTINSGLFSCHALREAAASLNIVEKPYSIVLYKISSAIGQGTLTRFPIL